MIVHTTDGDKNEPVYSIDSFNYEKVNTYPTVRKHNISYINIPCAFDIETTTIDCENPYSFMYHWQICIDDSVIFGRTWNELIIFFRRLINHANITPTHRIVFYVHNLAYEFQFMRNFFEWIDVFARQKRVPIKATMSSGIEFRCSYILTNMSLKKFLENSEGVTHLKEVGKYNYNKIRTSETILTIDEKSYCYNDVRGLCEGISFLLREDTIASIPITSTGYVRRHFRKLVLSNPKNKQRQKRCRLTLDQYMMLKEAFRGGNTHADALYVGEILEFLFSIDIASSYPFVMMCEKFPDKFVEGDASQFNKYLKEGYALLFRARLTGVKQKRDYGIPYIDFAHCRHLQDYTNDNGRILNANSLEITLTDIDYRIIRDTYEIEQIEISNLYIARYKYLPEELRQGILDFFTLKCTLKDNPDKHYEYMKSKNRLNSSYGMMVTDILNEAIEYEDNNWIDPKELTIDDMMNIINKFYDNWNTFLTYQWGVWVTAHARNNFQSMVNLAGESLAYGDTDSGKIYGLENMWIIEKLNADVMKKIESSPIQPKVEYDGKTYYMGIWEFEGIYKEFITLGAKKYCYKKLHAEAVIGKTHVYLCSPYETTVSGLGKKEGSRYINEHGIEEFKIGTMFKDSGRQTAHYNDCGIHEIEVDGVKMISASNVALTPTTYIMGVSDEYFNVLLKRYES